MVDKLLAAYIVALTADRLRVNMKVLRCSNQMDHKEYGEKTGLGERSELLETGKEQFTIDEVKKLAHYTKIKLDTLLFRDIRIDIKVE
jgi:hypothetical protein